MVKKAEKKVIAVLRGELVRNRTPGAWLVNLFRDIVKNHNITDSEWNAGIKKLVERMVRNGELDEARMPHKPGNLNNALCGDDMTWRTFISGIRLVLTIRLKQIARIRFKVVIEKRIRDTIYETEYTTTVHENKDLLDLDKRP